MSLTTDIQTLQTNVESAWVAFYETESNYNVALALVTAWLWQRSDLRNDTLRKAELTLWKEGTAVASDIPKADRDDFPPPLAVALTRLHDLRREKYEKKHAVNLLLIRLDHLRNHFIALHGNVSATRQEIQWS